jgi:DNA (cytosine-5)-methyltransferase 1
MKPTFGSLFAGVGGFDMGMEDAGWECKFQVEWDKHCQHILNKHWPDIPKWGDVSTVSGTEIPPVDCIIFGSPCQDLSVAGKRAGLQGERSGLFYEAVRIIKEMRHVTNGTFPRWAIWENVAGALSSNNGRDFAAVISEMAEAGAVLQEYALLDAQYFGIPQRRRRVFLVACFDPAIARNCPDPLLPVSESLRGNTAKGKPKGKVASRKIANCLRVGSGVGERGDGTDNLVIGFSHTQGLSAQPSEVAFPTLRTEGSGMAVAYDEYNDTISPVHHALRAGTKQSTGVLVENEYEEPTVFQPGTMVRLGGGVWEGTVPTLRAEAKRGDNEPHIHIHNAEPTMAVRRLTPLECERLMGWPDDHTRWKADGTEQADTHRYKQCGNGVASPVAKWIASHILKAHQ